MPVTIYELVPLNLISRTNRFEHLQDGTMIPRPQSTRWRMNMTAPKQSLKSLTFAVLPKIEANPVQERRTKTIARLEEQKQLFANPTFTRTVRTTVKADDGVRTIVEKQQRVAPWWVQVGDGSY